MKQFVCKQIYKKRIGNGAECSVYVKDLPTDLFPDDEINIIRDEGYYSENNSWDAHTVLVINRLVIETDEEYENRKRYEEKHKNFFKEQRYNNYLKLKEEFENGKETKNL